MRVCTLHGAVGTVGNVLFVDDLHFEVTDTVPNWLASAYDSFAATLPPGFWAPLLVTVKSAHGFGGVYVTGGGPIVIGMADVVSIARTYQSIWRTERRGRAAKRELARTAVGVAISILAHELGHAIDEQGFSLPHQHPEARADFVAGGLAAATGLDRAFGLRVFSLLGCEGPFCTHPPSRVRAHVYDQGHAHQTAAMIEIW